MANAKPLRIIEKPYHVSGPSGDQLCIRCDNGLTYTMIGLAEEIGLSATTMYKRLREMGWDNEKILSLPLQKKKKPVAFEFIDGCKDGDLVHLNRGRAVRCRPQNMGRIPAITPFERQMMREGVL